jgi:hypothetical protein
LKLREIAANGQNNFEFWNTKISNFRINCQKKFENEPKNCQKFWKITVNWQFFAQISNISGQKFFKNSKTNGQKNLKIQKLTVKKKIKNSKTNGYK